MFWSKWRMIRKWRTRRMPETVNLELRWKRERQESMISGWNYSPSNCSLFPKLSVTVRTLPKGSPERIWAEERRLRMRNEGGWGRPIEANVIPMDPKRKIRQTYKQRSNVGRESNSRYWMEREVPSRKIVRPFPSNIVWTAPLPSEEVFQAWRGADPVSIQSIGLEETRLLKKSSQGQQYCCWNSEVSIEFRTGRNSTLCLRWFYPFSLSNGRTDPFSLSRLSSQR